MDIKILIIIICYANTAPIPKPLMVSLLHKIKNEKFNKNAKVEKLTTTLGRSVPLIVKSSSKYLPL